MPEIDGIDPTPTFALIGKFITEFARTETVLTAYLRKLADVDDGVSRIFLNGKRLDEVMKIINGLNEYFEVGEDTLDRVDFIFKHLREISLVRDEIAHRWSHVWPKRIVLSNSLIAKHALRPQRTEYTVEMIRGATNDLKMIASELTAIMAEKKIHRPARHDLMRHYAWQYIPPERPPMESNKNHRRKSSPQ